ncbi:response regulator transcription factor [Methylocella sp.]|uniref:response regulator transcription factor n=1 Tax=Methylocella sp. TaxID=1978226 RepID=UPI0037847E3E
MTRPPQEAGPMAIVVEDDDDMRDALQNLFASIGLGVLAFRSAAEMTRAQLPDAPSCLVLDIRLPGVGGLEFQDQLAHAGVDLPIVFMTGHGDIPMTVRAMKAGAVDFLTKPFRDQDMIDAVSSAIARDRARRETRRRGGELQALYDGLTPREAEVMEFVVKGLLNKQIAGEMGLAEITVKIHRGHLMRKMGARSVADLVRMSEALGRRGGG